MISVSFVQAEWLDSRLNLECLGKKMMVLKTREAVPALEVETLSGAWSLAEQSAENFNLVVFYRGLHCPLCKVYTSELNRLVDDFAERGVSIVVVSSDSEERAQQAQADWKLDKLRMGYGLSVEQARAWGLHRSAGRGMTSIGVEEPAEFSEPAVYLIRADGTLYWASVNTMPFARPHFKEMLGALDFVMANDYPARGELS